MKRMASLATLVAAFPSVAPAKLRTVRRVWRADHPTLAKLVAQHAPKTEQWERSCFNPPSRMEVRRSACDELLGTFGVEHLGVHRKSGAHVYYCNTGDTYEATLIFHGNNAYIAAWGDLVERRAIREE